MFSKTFDWRSILADKLGDFSCHFGPIDPCFVYLLIQHEITEACVAPNLSLLTWVLLLAAQHHRRLPDRKQNKTRYKDLILEIKAELSFQNTDDAIVCPSVQDFWITD
jgi:hypothetical protein